MAKKKNNYQEYLENKKRIESIVSNAWLLTKEEILKNKGDIPLVETLRVHQNSLYQSFRTGDSDIILDFIKVIRDPRNLYFTCKHVFGVELLPFQILILRELLDKPFPMLIATRGASKSYLLALYAIIRAFFQQGSKVIITGAGFRQSKVIFEYCEKIWSGATLLRDIVGRHGASGRKSGPRRDVDRCELIIGDSMIIALPIGTGEKIRGQRGTHLLVDEWASIQIDIFETVIAGFAAVSSSPIADVKMEARVNALKTLGLWTPEQEELLKQGAKFNQTVFSGTAYYHFNHFYKYWRRYKAIIESQGDIHKLEQIFPDGIPEGFNWKDYCIFRLPVELVPKGFMDQRTVDKQKATSHSSNYNCEYGAVFVNDSNGFFKRSLIENCVCKTPIPLPSGPVKFNASIYGDISKKYIYGIDPASESDNFAIVILELHPDHRRVVYCWTMNNKLHKQRLKEGLIKESDYYSYCTRKVRDLMIHFHCEQIDLDSQGGGVAIRESLHDEASLKEGELPIWPIPIDGNHQVSDSYPGLHILNMINFASSDYTSEANHGLRSDMEHKTLIFPDYDAITISLAEEEDNESERLHDTLELCVMEIEELKDELTSIVHTQTSVQGRERWDTPEEKRPGQKKGKLRKDRYSALVMANMAARTYQRVIPKVPYAGRGGFVDKLAGVQRGKQGEDYVMAPVWFKKQLKSMGTLGRVIRRRGV